jgi:hypothetical protein
MSWREGEGERCTWGCVKGAEQGLGSKGQRLSFKLRKFRAKSKVEGP